MSDTLDSLEAIAAAADPMERASRAHALVARLAEISGEAYRLRREAVEVMISQDVQQTEIAQQLDITRARVGQILRSGPNPERALFSHDGGAVIVALGSKKADVDGGPQSDMFSKDAAEAFDKLAAAGNAYGITTSREVVAFPGTKLNLNQDRLIVLGSPKVLPFVGQTLASDPHYGFGQDETGRYVVEHRTTTVHRSPQDTGGCGDYAYVGRLPRPDGKGTFLYLAGIHAPGTNGAAQYLVDNAPELYRTAKDRLFSLLIRADYKSPEDRSITNIEVTAQLQLR